MKKYKNTSFQLKILVKTEKLEIQVQYKRQNY